MLACCHASLVQDLRERSILDELVDVPPYDSEAHLRLALKGYVTTSLGMIVRKRG